MSIRYTERIAEAVPAAGKPTFHLGEDEIEIGVGIHGEPGRRRAKMTDANTLARDMVAAILDDLQVSGQGTGEGLLLVNGFGGTPLMELYVMYQAARTQLTALWDAPVHTPALRRAYSPSH